MSDLYGMHEGPGGPGHRAETKAETNTRTIEQLTQQLERLTISCQAMWDLLKEHTQLTDKDIDAKVIEFNDSRFSKEVLRCEKCGSPTNARRTTCVMCGEPRQRQHHFETFTL